MKVKFVAEKIASSLVSLYSFFVMIVALMHVMVMDVIWPFAVAAAVVCPVWFWYVDKRWLSEKRIISWIIRLGALVAGILIFTIGRDKCPFYRYMENMAQESMKAYFEKNIQTDAMKFKSVKDVTKEETEEYFLVSATVTYMDSSGAVPTGTAVYGSSVQEAKGSTSGGSVGAVSGGSVGAISGGGVAAEAGDEEEVYITLYFDRWSGQYFASMEDMQQYWVNKQQE